MIIHGDCIEELRKLPDNSVDAVITDPPYGLSNTDPSHVAETITQWVQGNREYLPPVKGGGFMGKAWDSFVPPVAVWDECLRVLKPGGHLLSFAGSRTMDLMTLGIRLAGFDIRDSIAWLYGSGFPKSMDVSKAIDKAAGAEREVASEGKALKRMIPGADQNSTGSWIKDNGREYVPTVTTAATPEAQQWEGWGTALKPAFEPIVVARKPFPGTVAANVLEHGTGALNIDASRIETTDAPSGSGGSRNKKLDGDARTDSGAGMFSSGDGAGYTPSEAGRFPANVILDESQAAALDEQSGITKGRVGMTQQSSPRAVFNTINSASPTGGEGVPDSGGASRFFYCAKAGKAERPVVDGTAHATVKPLALMRYLVKLVTPPGGTVLEPFAGSGTTVEACILEGFRCIAIEREADYLPLIEARMNRAVESLELL